MFLEIKRRLKPAATIPLFHLVAMKCINSWYQVKSFTCPARDLAALHTNFKSFTERIDKKDRTIKEG